MLRGWRTPELIDPRLTLPGRGQPVGRPGTHLVLGTPFGGELPEGLERAIFAMGCFWGAERVFWQIDGVVSTAVGYVAGQTPNPSYEEVCSGRTNHAEAVLVDFDPGRASYASLLAAFLEAHDPSQRNGQGNDVGTQYRSLVVATTPRQRELAVAAVAAYGQALADRGLGPITTTVEEPSPFYLAEAYHQQYLAANPGGYCGLQPTGVACPALPA